MITLDQYVGIWHTSPDWTDARALNATRLLSACCALEAEMAAGGVRFPDNPATRSGVSGQTYGGFRPQACPIGAERSNHKQGLAVDRYDPGDKIDLWCMAHPDRLERHGIWIEHADATLGWSHWQIVPPRSGARIFRP